MYMPKSSQYQLSEITATIAVDEYIQNYRDADKFICYCKQCDRYNACWACPPFDFDVDKRLANYKNAYIIGTKVTLSDELLSECIGAQQCTDTSYRILQEVRQSLDGKILELEKQHPNSLAFSAGTCFLCKKEECMRISGKPCLHPDKIRPSLEACGFDIGKTTSQLLNIELKWGSQDRLPDYFVLVSGIFSTLPLSHQGNLV